MNETLLALVVDEGQKAWAEGVIARLHGGLGVIANDGEVAPEGCASMVVMLGKPPQMDAEDLVGRDVIARGTFEDRRLKVDNIEDRPEARCRTRPLAPSGETFVGSGGLDTLTRRPAVEIALMQDGALLATFPGEHGRQIALATDVERVRAALPGSMVIQSRWSVELRRQITTVLGDGGLVMSIGDDRDSEHQLRVAATLLHLPTTLAGELSDFPAEALSVDVLVKPLPAPGAPTS